VLSSSPCTDLTPRTGAAGGRLLLLGLCLLLSACSLPQLAYNNADWLLLDRIDDYVELTHEQRAPLAEALEVRLEEHRRHELPWIADALDHAAGVVERGLTRDDADWLQTTTLRISRDSVGRILPDLARTLLSLDPPQRRFLRQQLAERQRRLGVDSGLSVSPQARLERRVERTVDAIETVVGTLDAAQVDVVRAALAGIPDSLPLWMEYTSGRHDALAAALQRGASAEEVVSLLRASFIALDGLPPALAERRAQGQALRVQLLVDLDATLTTEQRDHAVQWLRGLRDDARALMANAA
jgi:hypothetical protein